MCLCYCSVPKSRLTLRGPVDCSTPGFPVLHYLLEFAQVQIYTYLFILVCHYLNQLCHIFFIFQLCHPSLSPGELTKMIIIIIKIIIYCVDFNSLFMGCRLSFQV